MFKVKIIAFSVVILALVLTRFWIIDSQKKSDLAKKTLVFNKGGQGKTTLVFLHGLLGSHRYWNPVLNQFGDEHEVIAVDLLGFGDSPKPYLEYSVADHVEYLLRTFKEAGLSNQKFILIGHSMGAILALNIANSIKGQVRGLILINPPIVTAENDLKNDLKESSSKFMVGMTFNKTWGKLICAIHEMMPILFYPMIRIFDPELPSEVAMDVTKHTWESFNGSLKNILQNQRFFDLIENVSNVPILLISSKDDPYSTMGELQNLKHRQNIEIKSFPGDHNFLLKSPKKVTDLLKQFETKIP